MSISASAVPLVPKLVSTLSVSGRISKRTDTVLIQPDIYRANGTIVEENRLLRFHCVTLRG